MGNTGDPNGRSVTMADDDTPPHPGEVPPAERDDGLDEEGEESFPASDPPATWSGPEESAPGRRTDKTP
jgi:hypothetical protein